MPAPKHGLGRGLGALIPLQPVRPASVEPGVEQVELKLIEPNPHQPRHQMRPRDLEDLANSIREHGLLQPLLLSPITPEPAEGPRYRLIAGERRWRAAALAGLERVPAIVRGVTPEQMLELALVENIQRADLNPLEEAEAYRQLMETFGLTQEQVAKKVGKDRTTVSNALRLLRLPLRLQQALADDQISEGHARVLLQLGDESRMLNMFKQIVGRNLSVRQTEELVRRSQEAPRGRRSRSTGQELPETRHLEEEFRRALGTKVELIRSSKGGRLIVEFYSDEELDAIYRLIVG